MPPVPPLPLTAELLSPSAAPMIAQPSAREMRPMGNATIRGGVVDSVRIGGGSESIELT